MARGKPFEKGKSGNPAGGKPLSPERRAFKQMTYDQFIDELQRYGTMTPKEMAEDLKREDTTVFQRMFGKIVFDAMTGQRDKIQIILERLWGKVKDKVEHSGTTGAQVVITLPDNGREKVAIEEKKEDG